MPLQILSALLELFHDGWSDFKKCSAGMRKHSKTLRHVQIFCVKNRGTGQFEKWRRDGFFFLGKPLQRQTFIWCAFFVKKWHWNGNFSKYEAGTAERTKFSLCIACSDAAIISRVTFQIPYCDHRHI